MQRLAPDPKALDAARLLYLATRAGAEALGLEKRDRRFSAGQGRRLRLSAAAGGQRAGAAVRHADDPAQALAALFTLAGAESVREVRVEGGYRILRLRRRMTLAELNASDRSGFVARARLGLRGLAVGGRARVGEAAVCDARRSARRDDVGRGGSAGDEQLALLRAHPDLGAARRAMSDASSREQAGAGLDALTRDELERLRTLNAAYREKFGFPFLYAVKGSTKHDILNALERRLPVDARCGAPGSAAPGLSASRGSGWRKLIS